MKARRVKITSIGVVEVDTNRRPIQHETRLVLRGTDEEGILREYTLLDGDGYKVSPRALEPVEDWLEEEPADVPDDVGGDIDMTGGEK